MQLFIREHNSSYVAVIPCSSIYHAHDNHVDLVGVVWTGIDVTIGMHAVT